MHFAGGSLWGIEEDGWLAYTGQNDITNKSAQIQTILVQRPLITKSSSCLQNFLHVAGTNAGISSRC